MTVDYRGNMLFAVSYYMHHCFREFFHLLSQELVNPQYALFQVTSTGLYKPNPFSSVNSNHLFYFEFCGKILAKSICEGKNSNNKNVTR